MTEPDAIRLARAVLLFHRGGHWTAQDRVIWRELTGSDQSTTRVLCDLARSILMKQTVDK